MTAARRFSGPELEELAKAKVLGVRAGAEHRYTGVWKEQQDFLRSQNARQVQYAQRQFFPVLRLEEMGLIACHYEIGLGALPKVERCTAMAVGPLDTNDGNTYVGQSHDYPRAGTGARPCSCGSGRKARASCRCITPASGSGAG